MADKPKKDNITLVSAEFYVRMEHSDGSIYMVKYKHQDLLNFLNNIEVGEPKTCENCNESEGCEHEILRSEGIACDEWSDD